MIKIIRKNYIDIITILGIIIISFSALSLVYDSTKEAFIWHDDQAIHLSAAKNLGEGKDSTIDFAPWWGAMSTDELIHRYSDISITQNGKGPIYYLSLAGFFKLTSADGQNFFILGGIFNLFLTSIFLVLYYFFCKKYFPRNVTILSCIVVALIPLFLWNSIRVLPIILVFIFIIMTFFFLQKNKQNYFIFGIISGLAHLTHPIGVIIGISYSIFLLLKKEFKGSLIVFSTSTLILIPWLIRNLIIFGNFGEGLGIPFASNLSKLLGFEQVTLSRIPPSNLAALPQIDFFNIEYSSIINKTFHNPLFKMDSVLILVIIGIITISLIVIFSKKNSKPKTEQQNLIERLVHFSIIFTILNILGTYLIMVTTNWTPDPRNIAPLFFLLIPFGIFHHTVNIGPWANIISADL